MVTASEIDTIIFDLDGTITEPFFDFDAIRQDMGLSPDAGPILELMETMTEEQRSHAQAVLDRHEKLGIEQSKLNEGAQNTLEKLRNAGINLAILTRNSGLNAKAVIDKHGLAFDQIVSRDDGPVKPDPFGVRLICERFSTTPERTLVVGDFLYDLQSAKAAGATAVLIKTHKDAEDFCTHADISIDSLAELLDIIEKTNFDNEANCN